MTQRNTSQHQTLPEARRKMWTFQFILSEHRLAFSFSHFNMVDNGISIF